MLTPGGGAREDVAGARSDASRSVVGVRPHDRDVARGRERNRDAEEVARVLDAGSEIMQVCVAAGGSLSGEHGIGLEKRDEMHRVFTEADLDAMLRMRAAWDPDERMNPGKAIPVRGCMEVKTKPLPVAAGGDDS